MNGRWVHRATGGAGSGSGSAGGGPVVCSGFVLLEVVLAVALLLIGLTVIGGQVSQSLDSSHRSEDLARIMMLTESKLAELDTGLVDFTQEADNIVEGDFTTRFPDYGWRMRFEETAFEGLFMVELDILFNPRERLEQDFDVDNARVVQSVYTLKAIPPVIDLQADFGLEDDAIELLSEQMPLEDFDPSQFNPAIFQTLEFEDLVTVLPALMQAFGISLEELRRMVPPEMRELLELGESAGLEGLEEAVDSSGLAPAGGGGANGSGADGRGSRSGGRLGSDRGGGNSGGGGVRNRARGGGSRRPGGGGGS